MNLLPATNNVSKTREYSLLNRGLTSGYLRPFKNEPNFGGYTSTGIPLPTFNKRTRSDGLGLEGPNQSLNTTVRSPALPEFDYYDAVKGISGVPMFVYKDQYDDSFQEDIRVDLTNLNYYTEKNSIIGEIYEGTRATGLTKRKSMVVGYEHQYGHSMVNLGYGSKIWPQCPFQSGRAPALRIGENAWMNHGVEWLKDFGDIGTDLIRKWELQGFTATMVDDQTTSGTTEDNDLRAATEISRSIVMAHAGDVEVKNLFSTNIRKGDWVYFIVAPTQVSQLGQYTIKPDGSVSQTAGPRDGKCIQVRGISSADGFNPLEVMPSKNPRRKQIFNSATMSGYVGFYGNEPFATETSLDVDYELKSKIMKQQGYIFEGDRIRATDGIEDLPDITMDIYRSGHVFPVGMVTYPGHCPNRESIMRGHRDMKALRSLPTARVLRIP